VVLVEMRYDEIYVSVTIFLQQCPQQAVAVLPIVIYYQEIRLLKGEAAMIYVV
jgi:hypothetical protein